MPTVKSQRDKRNVTVYAKREVGSITLGPGGEPAIRQLFAMVGEDCANQAEVSGADDIDSGRRVPSEIHQEYEFRFPLPEGSDVWTIEVHAGIEGK